MKNFVSILVLGSAIALSSCDKGKDSYKSIPCIPNGMSNAIIAFYPFSNGSLNDLSGNNNHLTNPSTASSAMDRNGNLNCAYEFDNLATSSEFLTSVNTSFLNNLTKFSISVWYQAKDTTRAGSDFEGLVHRGVGQSCPDRLGQWSVGLYDCRKAVFGRTNSVWDQVIANGSSCQAEINVRTDVWIHLLATYNSIGNTMKIYRNGILQNTSTGIANCGFSPPLTSQDIGDLFIGKNFTGKIDDVIIFNKDVSQSDVTTLYGMGTCCE